MPLPSLLLLIATLTLTASGGCAVYAQLTGGPRIQNLIAIVAFGAIGIMAAAAATMVSTTPQ